ncbi:MAG: SRPBCC family protein [Acidimicrobiia bacterium]|nr:SRPBCC family protein [Acidimicrobiia bacterium]
MPSASYSHTVTTPQSAAAIWKRLNDPDTWLAIGPVEGVDNAELSTDGHLEGFDWYTTVGPRKITGTAKVTESTKNQSMTLSLDAGELVGDLSASLDKNGKGSDLTVSIDITSKGGMASLFFPVISEVLGRGLPEQVEEFAATL